MAFLRSPEVGAMLDFLNCPSRCYPTGSVPESEIRCRYESCIFGMGVAGNGICGEGNPRDAACAAYRQECPQCHGDGGWNGEKATCKECGGWGYYR